MTTPLSQEARAELVARAKAELADHMHGLAWKFLDYRLTPHDDFYHFAAVDSWRTAERYRIILDALSALTEERDAALERVKACVQYLGPGRYQYGEWSISYDPPPIPVRTQDWSFTHRDFDASYEGPEDGWVSNGKGGRAASLDEAITEIDEREADHA